MKSANTLITSENSKIRRNDVIYNKEGTGSVLDHALSIRRRFWKQYP